jgi:hypothetical protein
MILTGRQEVRRNNNVRIHSLCCCDAGTWDMGYKVNVKKKHKRELIPYIVLSIAAIVIGYINFSHPYQQGIVNFLLDLIKAKR